MLLVADRVACNHVLQTDRGADVAGENFGDFLALVGVHLHQSSDALAPSLGDVVNGFAGVEFARVHTDERQLADERVGRGLEHQGSERIVVDRPCRPVSRSGLSGSMPVTGSFKGGRQVIGPRHPTCYWTPLFLKADPQITGKIFWAMVTLERPAANFILPVHG